jgi:Lysozyme inhibitor LprI
MASGTQEDARLRLVFAAQGGGYCMRTITLIGLALAVCLPQLVIAGSTGVVLDERSLREECSAFSQAGMRDCLARRVEESQKALTRAEQRVVNALSNWDEDKKYIDLAKSRFGISSTRFNSYRKDQCEFFASLTGGAAGDAHEIRRLACVAELNSRRAEQLRTAVANLPTK